MDLKKELLPSPKNKYTCHTRCCVPGCSNRPSPDVSIHRFPRDKNLAENWKSALKITKRLAASAVVCSNHFQPNDIINKYINKTDAMRVKAKLRPSAIPSYNLPSPANVKMVRRYKPRRKQEEIYESSSSDDSDESDTETPTEEENEEDEDEHEVVAEQFSVKNEPSVKEEPQTIIQETTEIEFLNMPVPLLVPPVHNSTISEADNIYRSFIRSEEDLLTSTGIKTFQILQLLLNKIAMRDNFIANAYLNTVDSIILVFIKLKQNLSYEFLSVLFRLSSPKVELIFRQSLFAIYHTLTSEIYWPTRLEIELTLPDCFQNELSTIRALFYSLDVELPKSSINVGEIGERRYKYLIGVTPSGFICYVSPGYNGNVTEKYIFEEQKLFSQFETNKDYIMLESGFDVEHEFAQQGINAHPDVKNISCEENANTNEKMRDISTARTYNDHIMEQIKSFWILRHRIEVDVMLYVDRIALVICALSNLNRVQIKEEH